MLSLGRQGLPRQNQQQSHSSNARRRSNKRGSVPTHTAAERTAGSGSAVGRQWVSYGRYTDTRTTMGTHSTPASYESRTAEKKARHGRGQRSRQPSNVQAGPTARGARPVALLALFEGLGTTRLAMDVAIKQEGRRSGAHHGMRNGSLYCTMQWTGTGSIGRG